MPIFEKPSKPVSKAQKRYKAFVDTHGELYEKTSAPMDPEDLKQVEYNYRFTKRITIPVTVGIYMTIFGTLLWLGLEWFKILIGALMLLGLTGFLASLVSHYKELLEKREKTVIKGVVTQKKSFSSGYYHLFLSEQKDIEVTQAEFEQCKGGEIVEISFLSDQRPLRRSFRIIDRLPELEQ